MELDVHASNTCSNAGRSAEGGGREPTLAITLSQYFPGFFFPFVTSLPRKPFRFFFPSLPPSPWNLMPQINGYICFYTQSQRTKFCPLGSIYLPSWECMCQPLSPWESGYVSTVNLFILHKAEFLNLCTIDIWGRQFFAVLCDGECSAASLASRCQ